jgi:hypothetical protein
MKSTPALQGRASGALRGTALRGAEVRAHLERRGGRRRKVGGVG